ncbi:Dps family protein [Pararhodobacter oceanensis]|uniref:Dps family protein n=1 Tax=Pararhodobacter oceanensis TaxID=2172121 RepID=UPI003A91BB0E
MAKDKVETTSGKDAGSAISNVKTVAEGLSDVLSETYRLVLKTHIYHWNVTGPQFRSIHMLTEEHYTEMFGAVDVLAERIRALGKPAMVAPQAFQSGPDSAEPDAGQNAQEMVAELQGEHERLAARMRALVETAEEAKDFATGDLATARAAFHEKAAWMLRASAA